MRLPGLSMRSIVIDMSCSGWWYEVVGSSGNISTGIQLLQESVIRHVHLLRPGGHILNARGHLMMLEMGWRFYTGLRQHDREERH